MARIYEGGQRDANLREMRLHALRYLRLLERFHPKLIGSVLTGHIRRGSDIDIHVFSDSIQAVALELEDEHIVFDLERKEVRKDGEARVFHHLHVHDQFPIELTIYPTSKLGYGFKSSITGKSIERAGPAELKCHWLAPTADHAVVR